MKKTTVRTSTCEIVETITLSDLSRTWDMPADWIIDLVEHGILDPVDREGGDWVFHSTSLSRTGRAMRLRRDLGINLAGIGLILDLLEDRDRLMRKLQHYEPRED